MSNPAITNQPGAGGYGTNVQTGEWSTSLCACHNDCLVCALGFFCPLALSCYTANKYGENCCLGWVPGGMTAMRTHMRLTYGIQGTVCNDALMTCCCGGFEVCRMAREIRIRNGEVSLVQREQLTAIFQLLKENKETFGDMSEGDLEEQLRLYSI